MKDWILGFSGAVFPLTLARGLVSVDHALLKLCRRLDGFGSGVYCFVFLAAKKAEHNEDDC